MQTTVLIAGAGLSGLVTAYRLEKAGYANGSLEGAVDSANRASDLLIQISG